MNKSLLSYLSEAVDRYRAEKRVAVPEQPLSRQHSRLHWLGRQLVPNMGTVLMVIILLLTVPSLAAPMRKPLQQINSTNTISYQGRLANSAGNPLTGKYNIEFRIYDVPTGGTPLWTEMWTGGNAVDVSDGLFNVMLGSINNTLTTVIQGRSRLYLGITVNADSEMVPRVQLGSVPFSMQALTVADGSITTVKIADGAVTLSKLGEQPYYFHGAFATPTEWMADVIWNGNYARFCQAIGRTYVRADELQAHFDNPRGNGFFYQGWYYVGMRVHESDIHMWGDGEPGSYYNAWLYNGGAGVAQPGFDWTYERSAIIWCR